MTIAPRSHDAPAVAHLDQVRRTYDTYAPWYDRLFGSVLEPGRRALTATVSEYAPARLLEIGVGTGLTLHGYPAKTQVVGIDVSPDMLERAQARASAMPDRDISLHEMDAERLEFRDKSFDCVTLPYVLSVTPEPARLVSEARRVCKDDGLIIIVNHFSGSRFWWLMERAVRSVADRVGFRSSFSFEEHVGCHDWRIERIVPVNLFALSRLVVIRN